jgi:hypothetical protein
MTPVAARNHGRAATGASRFVLHTLRNDLEDRRQ